MCFRNCLQCSRQISLQSPRLQSAGRPCPPASQPQAGTPQSVKISPPRQHLAEKEPFLQGRAPAPAAGLRSWRKPGAHGEAVGAGPGGAAPGRTGRWDAPRAGPAPARGRSGAGAAAAATSVGGRVLGTWRAANAAAALEPRGLCARDELHPEKGLLQAGRQQDRLGAAQDLRVPDPRRQRGLWRGVVRPLGMHARCGEQGAPGRRGGPTAGARAPGRRWSLPHGPGPGQRTSSALPGPPWVSLLPLRTWVGASP